LNWDAGPSSAYVIPDDALLELDAAPVEEVAPPGVLGGEAGVPGDVVAPGDPGDGGAPAGAPGDVVAPGDAGLPDDVELPDPIPGRAFVKMNCEAMPAVPTAPGVAEGELDGAAWRQPVNVIIRGSPDAVAEFGGV
jgi:hypothetical protein